MQVAEIVGRAERTFGAGGCALESVGPELRLAHRALVRVRQVLFERLESGAGPHTAALAIRAEQVGVALKEAQLTLRQVQIERATAAVNRLRSATSIAELAERIPAEAHRLGFSRVLFSRIRSGTWLPCSAFVGDDRDRADELLEAGMANPRRLAGLPLESDMVRTRHPIVVRQPRTNPRVHPELIAVTDTSSYVAAPVFSWGQAIGLVHADRPSETTGVDEFDSEVLGELAEGVGIAFERNLILERLRSMRHAAEEYLQATQSLADDFTLEALDLAGPGPQAVEHLLDLPTHEGTTRPLNMLTTRELEVLHNMAAGKSNAQIAATLFVTVGTIKSHVKHILRKLGAANRTEAVIRYHRTHNPWLAGSSPLN